MSAFGSDARGPTHPLNQPPGPDVDADLHDLLTVDDVAALLKVSKSWVYEHTRARGRERAEHLECLKIGKYMRFERQAVRDFLVRRSKRPAAR